jgi:hypothetical protein
MGSPSNGHASATVAGRSGATRRCRRDSRARRPRRRDACAQEASQTHELDFSTRPERRDEAEHALVGGLRQRQPLRSSEAARAERRRRRFAPRGNVGTGTTASDAVRSTRARPGCGAPRRAVPQRDRQRACVRRESLRSLVLGMRDRLRLQPSRQADRESMRGELRQPRARGLLESECSRTRRTSASGEHQPTRGLQDAPSTRFALLIPAAKLLRQ